MCWAGDVLVVLRRRRCQSAPSTLQNQTDEVAGNKDQGIRLRLDARSVYTDMAHNVAEREVDGGREEGGRKRDAADTDEEAVKRERVVPRYEAANVADDFGGATERHGSKEVGFSSDSTLDNVGEAGESEECEEGRVGGKGGPIVHD